jgi:hypothetical protein
MNEMASKDLLVLGSIPLNTAEEVFRWIAESGLASHLACAPDGEVGDRSYWITGLAYRLFNGHPDIETVLRPDRINGVENWKPQRGIADQWTFRLKDGVKELRFGEPDWRLGYTRDALNSYYVFRDLREKGLLPSGMRFQVCLPMTVSTCTVMFRGHLGDLPKVVAGFDDAMAAELGTICEKIPPRDLVIQFDSTGERGAVGNPKDPAPFAGAVPAGVNLHQMVIDSIAKLSALIPGEALFGYHLCYGSLTEWPMQRPKDLSDAVKCMNTMLEKSQRRVDYIHFPVLDHADPSYYAPLRDLETDKTKYYLGVIHYMDDLDDYRRRLELAGKYLKDFGIGAPCGYGRLNPERLPRILKDHLTAVDLFEKWRA